MRSLAALVAAAAALTGCGFEAPNYGEDGQPITVGFLATASLQDEASGAVTIPVGLNGPAEELVSVRYRFTGGTATNGADYVGSDNTLTIPPGATEAKIPLTINMDALEEQAETIKVELSDPVGALLGTSQHTVTISRDILPRVKFESNSSQADEATSPVLRVSLDVASEIQVSVDYVITGTASASSDYTLPAGTLVFPPGVMTKDLSVPVTDDALDEFDEDFLVTLTSSTNVVVGSVASHDHTIVDNDLEPTVGFQTATQSRSENGLVVAVTVKLSAPSGKPIKVDLSPGAAAVTDAASNGSDYIFTPVQLKFDPGQTQQTTNILILDDNTDENDEDFTAVLSVQTGYNVTLGPIATETITITDDDNPPSVEFADQSVIVNEGDSGTTPVNFDVQLSRASAKPITIPIVITGNASEGSDYTITGNPITIAPGQTTGRITVNVVGDTTRETASNGTEDVILSIPSTGLTNVTRGGNNTTRFVTIKDDD